MNLEEDQVGRGAASATTRKIGEGAEVKRTGRIMSRGPSAEAMIGPASSTRSASRSTGKGPHPPPRKFIPLERIAPGVIERQPVREPMAHWTEGHRQHDSSLDAGQRRG